MHIKFQLEGISSNARIKALLNCNFLSANYVLKKNGANNSFIFMYMDIHIQDKREREEEMQHGINCWRQTMHVYELYKNTAMLSSITTRINLALFLHLSDGIIAS